MSNKALARLSVWSVAGLLSGCAGVTFYSDPQLSQKTGIPVYTSKPYLLVARTGAKEKPVEVSVVYLNDPASVVYAYPHSGFGSSKLSLALVNGQLSSFGQETDPKIAELIASVSGLITARAGATKTEAEAKDILSKLQGAPSTAEIAKTVNGIADEMLSRLKSKQLDALLTTEKNTVTSAASALSSSARALADPTQAAITQQNLQTVKEQADNLAKLPTSLGSTSRDLALQYVHAWADKLQKLFDSAQPEKPEPPTFELYEIIQSPSGASIKRVTE